MPARTRSRLAVRRTTRRTGRHDRVGPGARGSLPTSAPPRLVGVQYVTAYTHTHTHTHAHTHARTHTRQYTVLVEI